MTLYDRRSCSHFQSGGKNSSHHIWSCPSLGLSVFAGSRPNTPSMLGEMVAQRLSELTVIEVGPSRTLTSTLSNELIGHLESEFGAGRIPDAWMDEHGQDYAQGITAMFDARMGRIYESYWNLCSQDVFQLLQLLRESSSGCANVLDVPATGIEEVSASIQPARACSPGHVQVGEDRGSVGCFNLSSRETTNKRTRRIWTRHC